jgi:hypothetical protein
MDVIDENEVDIFPKISKPLIFFPEHQKRSKTIDMFLWTQTSIMSTRAMWKQW